jgi:hypothetical protein
MEMNDLLTSRFDLSIPGEVAPQKTGCGSEPVWVLWQRGKKRNENMVLP